MKAMKERQMAHRESKLEEHEAAMQAMKAAMLALEIKQVEEMQMMTERDEEEISAAMQAFEIEVAACRVYHEAPDDVFELIVLQCSDVDNFGWGAGGLNNLRLVSKRCMQVVESVATWLSSKSDDEDSLPISALKRCKRIENIACYESVESLNGCPAGLKSLVIENGDSLENLKPLSRCKGLVSLCVLQASLIDDLSPLSACRNLQELEIVIDDLSTPKIADISPLSSCKRLKRLILPKSEVIDLTTIALFRELEELNVQKRFGDVPWYEDPSSVVDLSPLSHCQKLKKLDIAVNYLIKDLTPLRRCLELEDLMIAHLPLINDLSVFQEGFHKLRALNIIQLNVADLSPLTKLQSLEDLDCYRIPNWTSLLPLVRCPKLKKLRCSGERVARNSVDMQGLRAARPDLKIV